MTDRALVIGIDAYDGLRHLAAAQRDAGHMAEWLKRPKGGGVLPEHVDLRQWKVEGGGGAQILREVVLDAVVAWIRERNTSGQVLGRRGWFYFAGHGTSVRDDNGEVACLMANAATDLTDRHVPAERVLRALVVNNVFDEVVVVTDCCRDHDTATAVAAFTAQNGQPGIPQTSEYAQLFATRWSRQSREQDDLPDPLDPSRPNSRQGRFTHALLSTLREHGTIEFSVLRDVVTERVRNLAGKFEFVKPEMVSSAKMTFGAAPPAVPSTTVPTPPMTEVVELSRGGRSVARSILVAPAGADLVLDLLPGLYKLRFLSAAGVVLGVQTLDVV